MIICCGESLIDFIPTKDNKAYQPYPGGSIFNIAVGLGRMQIPVGFLSRLSTDLFGDLLENHLLKSNVDLRFCPRIAGPTTLAFVSLNPQEKHAEPQYAFYAEGAVDRSLNIKDLPTHFPDNVKALHFGSISLVLEPGASTFESLMRREKGKRIITLDPNVRPIVINNWDAYRKRFEGWLTCVDILRMSHVDFKLLYPSAEIQQILPKWFSMGIKLVILTQGIDGAIAFHSNGANVFVKAVNVETVDTIGAGDSFFSGALTYLYENKFLTSSLALAEITTEALRNCLHFASLVAALNCAREGADLPYRHEIDHFIARQNTNS